MNALEELAAEHDAVKVTLQILERISREVERAARIPDPEHVRQILEFLGIFVDKCHHGKEEELLFPAMEAVGVSRKGGPLGMLLDEHQQGRTLVARMQTALSQYLNGDADAALKLRKHADAYVELLNYHIDKENEGLFPMVAKHLPPDKRDELRKGFERIETERIGKGKHEALHRMLAALEDAYLRK